MEKQASNGVTTEPIKFPDLNNQANLSGYLAQPSGKGPFPAIVVIHEIWGLVPHIEDVARRLARAGYVAFAPDVYSRGELPVTPEDIQVGMQFMLTLPMQVRADPAAMQAKLGELPEARRSRISRTMQWLQTRDLNQSVADVQAALHWLAQQPFVRADRIASLGFCMGGTLSGRLAASGAALAGCVIFYGENPPQVENIRCPVLGLYGNDDHRITDKVPELVQAMQRAGKAFDYHIYPGAAHAFFNDTRDTFRAEAAADAWKRVQSFLREYLNA
jgi:carboxymethylenebutenolidase